MNGEEHWTVYRTRFLVRACQLTAAFSFTDALGREHSGCAGDYLVESSPGCVRITARKIFEDVYVPLLAQPETEAPQKAREMNFCAEASGSEASHYSLRGVADDSFRASA